MIRSTRRVVAAMLVCMAPLALAAESSQPVPPWLEPDVVKAAIDIGLDDAQLADFRRIVGDFLTKRMSMIQQEFRRSPPNLENAIRTKSRRLEKAMDADMKGVLTEPQWPGYEHYKDVLFSKFEM
ncbi:MAG: hypothetical protein HC809_06485 [Gammaproteobacteria bacterium]|nr:hypothetical protein [Gammaproteobacteria bacterium]